VGKDEGKQSRGYEKVTALVQAVENLDDAGFKVSRFQGFKDERQFKIR
jgi:hypothetical protein